MPYPVCRVDGFPHLVRFSAGSGRLRVRRTPLLQADIEAHSQLKYINKKLASNSAMWTSLPNESNFGPRKGKARWEPEIHEYTLLNEEPQPGLSLVCPAHL